MEKIENNLTCHRIRFIYYILIRNMKCNKNSKQNKRLTHIIFFFNTYIFQIDLRFFFFSARKQEKIAFIWYLIEKKNLEKTLTTTSTFYILLLLLFFFKLNILSCAHILFLFACVCVCMMTTNIHIYIYINIRKLWRQSIFVIWLDFFFFFNNRKQK